MDKIITVFDFYCGCGYIPRSARVNIYDANTKRRVAEDYQNLTGDFDFDFAKVRGYKWNPRTQLLKIYAA